MSLLLWKDHHWTLVSNNLMPTSRRFTLRHLSPETHYELKVRANNDAGSTERIFDFTTISNTEELGSGSSLDYVEEAAVTGLVLVVPVVVGALLVVVFFILLIVFVRRSKIKY